MNNPYPHYKPSGVDWLGRIPAHWEVKKLKYVAKMKSGEAITADSIRDDHEFPVYGGNGLRGFTKSYTHEGNYVLIGRQGALCGNINYASGKFWASEHAVVLTIQSEHNFRWLGELLQTMNLNQYSVSAAQPGLAIERVRDLQIPLPPLTEQTAIANYLDEKTVQIDTLIGEKRELINLLKEERSGLINETVTQGLHPRVPRKDSGLPWLGEIPAHWEVKKLKYVISKVIGGGTPSTTEKSFWDGEIPWVSPKDMKVELIENTQDYVTDLAIQKSATSLVPAESVLIVVRSGILKHTFPIAISSVEVTLNQDMKALIPKSNLSNQFLKWLLKGMQKFILTYCSKLGATVDSIETEALFNFTFSYPPLEEQAEIVAYLDSETARIDDTVKTVEEEIELLTEYRSALISEVVTGKQKVS